LPRFELLGLQVTGAVGGAPIGFISPITAACFLAADLTLLVLIAPGDQDRMAAGGPPCGGGRAGWHGVHTRRRQCPRRAGC